MTPGTDPAPLARFGMLRTIALYKLLKVVILLLAAWGEIRLHDASLSGKLLSWAANRPQGLEHDLVTRALAWFSGLSESRVHALRFVTLTYAAVFAVEGIGLWMQRRWAEWLTTIITASLIPLPLLACVHSPTPLAPFEIHDEMIFISDQSSRSGVFFSSLDNTTAGDPMIKLIASALLSVGIAAAAMAADMPKSAATMAADAPAAGTSSSTASKPVKKTHSKKAKKSTPAPSTSK
jgi:uncharacterized membrane protein (DUF2068 family)